MSLFVQIRSMVKQISPGFVSTYGDIARVLKTNPRVVGWALMGNEDVSIPCHRVVKSKGILADSFSLGNWPEQRRRLSQEGVKFKGQQIDDFESVHFSAFKIQ